MGMGNSRALGSSCGRLALCGALLFAGGCLMWFEDERPWLVNSTSEMLEVQSTHSDGHKLKIMLYPGSRVPLGATEQPIREIAVKRPREPEMTVPESEIRSCLEDRARGCQGWNVSAEGLEPIATHRPTSHQPPAAAEDDGTGATSGEDGAAPAEHREGSERSREIFPVSEPFSFSF